MRDKATAGGNDVLQVHGGKVTFVLGMIVIAFRFEKMSVRVLASVNCMPTHMERDHGS